MPNLYAMANRLTVGRIVLPARERGRRSLLPTGIRSRPVAPKNARDWLRQGVNTFDTLHRPMMLNTHQVADSSVWHLYCSPMIGRAL